MSRFITDVIDDLVGLELYMKVHEIRSEKIQAHLDKIYQIIEEAKEEVKKLTPPMFPWVG